MYDRSYASYWSAIRSQPGKGLKAMSDIAFTTSAVITNGWSTLVWAAAALAFIPTGGYLTWRYWAWKRFQG